MWTGSRLVFSVWVESLLIFIVLIGYGRMWAESMFISSVWSQLQCADWIVEHVGGV